MMFNLSEIIKKYKKTITILSLFVCLLYSYYTLHELTNVGDGFWQQSFHYAGDVERASGRWIWPYVDVIQRGLHMEPINMLVTMFIFIIGFILTLYILDVKDGWLAAIGGCIFFSTPIFSAIVSYRFMSIIYALAFLAAVLAAVCNEKIKNRYWAIFLAAVCFSISMGLYQSYIGIFCLVGLISFVLILLQNDDYKEKLLEAAIRYFVSLFLGGILYFVSLKINLKITGSELSDYRGINSINILTILQTLPSSIRQVYRIFWFYIRDNLMRMNILNTIHWELAYHCILFVAFVGGITWNLKKNKKLQPGRIIILLCCIVLVPVACGFANILALGADFMPQTGGPFAFFSAISFAIVCKLIFDNNIQPKKLVAGVVVTGCVINVYGQTMQVLMDHKVMQEDYTATVSLMQGLLQDLNSKGMLTSEKEYFFIGMPSANPLFGKSELRSQVNEYAKVGSFWLSGTAMAASYTALLQNVMGLNLHVSYDEYESKAYDEYYQNMPCYPYGEYAVAWDTIIVKVSEP
ncbi:MAG: glucosyltransferase domain-containing protein [Lachnospiraceae bacterium]|nr:glucosyltransferase domain-containing protein [Lachnospiraceae bacterium]